MPTPKILVFSGSIRSGSYNASLAALAAKALTQADADVTHISLADYALPLYDADREGRSGAPQNAINLKQMMMAHHGVFIVSPEYNASVTPLLKNTIDWVSRVRDPGETPLAAYHGRAFAIAGASPGAFGAMRSLLALRQILEVGCGALVIPDQVTVPHADKAFDDLGGLADPRSQSSLERCAQRLIDVARMMM